MPVSLKTPSWKTTLWIFILSLFRDGRTSGSTAAAFVPEAQWQQASRVPLHNSSSKRKQGLPFATKEKETVTLASTAAATSSATTSTQPTVSSVTRIHLPPFYEKKNPWTQLVPSIQLGFDDNNTPRPGVDVTLDWQSYDDVTAVARSMLEKPQSTGIIMDDDALVEQLAECMLTFQSFCEEHLQVKSLSSSLSSLTNYHQRPPIDDDKIQGFRARIVATRGKKATKCPKWHVDHVPVRWIQSLVGPGCNYIERAGDNSQAQTEWNRIQHYLERDAVDAIIPNPGSSSSSQLQAHQAEEQQIILLVGKRWNEFTKECCQPFVPPVLHKSPEIPFWQGRVLLTMDVIVQHHNEDE